MTAWRWIACAVLVAVSVAGCSGDNRQGKPFTLPSGHGIRILSVAPLHYTSGAPPSLMFRYQTDLNTSNKAALRKEADEIWTLLRIDAEKGRFTSAIISANEVPEGVIFKKSRMYNFVYEKRADGIWHSLDDERAGAK
jgi:hypothetical protein